MLAFALIGSAHAASATMKPEPSGIYDLLFGAPGTGKIDLTGNPLLTNANIDGFRYKVGWAKIQPDNAATFKWDSIDSAIAIAAANGKKLCISISGGLSVPGWAYTTAPVIYKYTMQETDPNTGLSIGSQPLPWDTAYPDNGGPFSPPLPPVTKTTPPALTWSWEVSCNPSTWWSPASNRASTRWRTWPKIRPRAIRASLLLTPISAPPTFPPRNAS